MKHLKIRLTLAVSICLMSTFLLWLSGYNFDQRGMGIALWAGMTLLVAIVFGAIPL